MRGRRLVAEAPKVARPLSHRMADLNSSTNKRRYLVAAGRRCNDLKSQAMPREQNRKVNDRRMESLRGLYQRFRGFEQSNSYTADMSTLTLNDLGTLLQGLETKLIPTFQSLADSCLLCKPVDVYHVYLAHILARLARCEPALAL